jgi:hypothetical protein
MSPDEHIEYAPFEAEALYGPCLHKRRQGFRNYLGLAKEVD